MTQNSSNNSTDSSSNTTFNIILYVIIGIVAIVITAVIAFLHFRSMKQLKQKKQQQLEQSATEQTEGYEQESEASGEAQESSGLDHMAMEDVTTVLFGNSYVSNDMGKREEIRFEGTIDDYTIKYSADYGSTSLLGKENSTLYFLNAPSVKYYLSDINENGFSLKNPDGTIQSFTLIEK